MKRLTIVVVALFVVSLVAASAVWAQDAAPAKGRGRGYGQGRGFAGQKDGAPGAEGQGQKRPGSIHRAVQRMVMIAVTAPWAKEDAELQRLVDKTIRDRKALYRAEGEVIRAFEAFVAAAREAENKEDLKDEHEALKAAHQAQREAAKVLGEDLKAIHEKLQELCPDRDGDGPVADRPSRDEMRERMRERRKNRGGDDLPPVID